MNKYLREKIIEKEDIGGLILLANPTTKLKEIRLKYNIKQLDLTKELNFKAPSIISDYEAGRRKSPGILFVKNWIEALVNLIIQKGEE